MADTHMALAEVKDHLSEVVDRVEREQQRVVITKHGRPAAVLVSVEDLEGLEETLDIMRDPETMKALEESREDIRAGRVVELTKEEALRIARGE